MAVIDNHPYESIRADEVREGDTLHHDGRPCVCWGIEAQGPSQVTLYLRGLSHSELDLWRPVTTWNSNPIWISEYDAKVTGRAS
jgi:hypothetical protein